VYVNHGMRSAQRIMSALGGDAKVVRDPLDPTEQKIRARFDNLDRNQQKEIKKGR
jgi:hypothetical protein